MSKPIMKPRQIRVPDAVWNWLKRRAAAQERSTNWFVNRVLEQAQKQEAPNA